MAGGRLLPKVEGIQFPDIGLLRGQAAQRRTFEAQTAAAKSKKQTLDLARKIEATDQLIKIVSSATDQQSLDFGIQSLPPEVQQSIPLQFRTFSPKFQAQARAQLIPAKLRFEAEQKRLAGGKPVTLGAGQQLISPTGERIGARQPTKIVQEFEDVFGRRPENVDELVEFKKRLSPGKEAKPTTGKIVKFERLDDKGQILKVTQRERPGQPPEIISEIPKVEKGERITIDATTGEVIIERGVGVTGKKAGLTKATQNLIQKQLFNAKEGLIRLDRINQGIQDKFLTIPGKLQILTRKGKAKLGLRLNAAETKSIQEFSKFAQDSIENINLYIKEITGAQMSEAEADRLRKAVADIGDGLFSGDDPVTFRAKLGNTIVKLKMAVARLNYINNKGFLIDRDNRGRAIGFFDGSGTSIELESMPRIMSNREDAIRAELVKQLPNSAPDEIEALVVQRLGQEFGLGQ